jgi:serine/threonine-protein kinase
MSTCPLCDARYDGGETVCAKDGEALLPDEALVASDQDLARGQAVGEYVIDAKLGEGGFGAVYQATHPLIGKQVAVKVLYRQYSSSPAMVARFVAEARAVNQIKHKSIIDIFSFGQLDDGRHYYVMELLAGAPLDRLLKARGRLAPSDAAPLLRGLARALDAVHEKGIFHRDLKPANVFICLDGDDDTLRPKLLDFGIAKLGGGTSRSPKTQTGAPLGTPFYMSPEQCRGKPVDHRTDVYSFGILAYQALTGQVPFDDPSYMEILLKQITEPPDPPSRVCPELPAALDAPILAMLAKDPAQRPPSVGEAVRALEEGAGIDAQGAPSADLVAAVRELGNERAAPPAAVTVALGKPRKAAAAAPDGDVALAATLAAPTPAPSARSPGQSFVAAEKGAPARRSASALVPAAAGFALAGALGAVWFFGLREEARPAVAPVAVTAPAPAPRAPDAPAPESNAAPAAPSQVHLDVVTRPTGAHVVLDGDALGDTPGDFAVPRGAAARTLELVLPGHEPKSLPIVPNDNLHIDVTLDPLPPLPARGVVVPHPQPKAPVPVPPAPPAPPKRDKETLETPDWTR